MIKGQFKDLLELQRGFTKELIRKMRKYQNSRQNTRWHVVFVAIKARAIT